MRQRNKTRWVALTGLMAALVIVGSYLRSPPTAIGTFNTGNTVCALAGLILGPVGGGLASAIGSALYDILFYPTYLAESWITFLTKGSLGLVVGLIAWQGNRRGLDQRRNVLAAAAGVATYLALYLLKGFAWNGLFMEKLSVAGALIRAVNTLPASALNGALAVVAAPILAAAIRKAMKPQV